MTKMQIEQRDIVNGERRNCGACPIALSVNRHLKDGLHCDICHTYGSVYCGDQDRYTFKLPQAAVDFIQNFDSEEVDVEPFQMEVDIPHEYLRLN